MSLKFKEPHVIRATYRIVTPMFIGDAEQKASGISPASVKGALRFWWRALNWGSVRTDTRSDEDALKALHAAEGDLFGSSAEKGRAARFTLRVDVSAITFNRAKDWPRGGNDPSGYLGLGLWESGSHEKGNFQAHREYVKEDQLFTVILQVNPDVDREKLKGLTDALKAWGVLGGLGSRSRRAFGSVSLEQLNETSLSFKSLADYRVSVEQLFAEYRLYDVELPPFTALCEDTRFAINEKPTPNARLAHAALGIKFMNYRGQAGSLRGSVKRVFGMPLAGGSKAEGEARRASPLLFHVHPIGSQFVGAVLFMPAHFHHQPTLDNPDYAIADNFLEQLDGEHVL